MNKLFYRPIIVIGLGLALVILSELLALGSMTWRNLDRIQTIKQDIKHGHRLQQLVFELLNNRLKSSVARISVPGDDAQVAGGLHKKIVGFLEGQHPEARGTKDLLAKLQKLLISAEQGSQQDLINGLMLSRQVLQKQINEEERLLEQVYQDTELELNLAIIFPSVAFAILFVIGGYFLSSHVINPLNALNELLSNLATGQKIPIAADNVAVAMRPLFTSYNQLLTRLSELEKEHLDHTQSLEREIRNATHALLEQSHTLARAERLAAVGELAASAAHELRNPLAGIQVALENMHQDCEDDDLAGRLKLVNGEINRLTGRLNDLLAYSRQAPERPREIDLNQLIDQLMTLLKYQVNENVTLVHDVQPGLRVVLPENEFRQALLNLLLNAIQSIGDAEGKVTLKAFAGEGRLAVEIKDTGPGFPKALLENGVQAFASYKEQGTGLGLAMVQRFVRSNRGSLTLANDERQHACATITLEMNL